MEPFFLIFFWKQNRRTDGRKWLKYLDFIHEINDLLRGSLGNFIMMESSIESTKVGEGKSLTIVEKKKQPYQYRRGRRMSGEVVLSDNTKNEDGVQGMCVYTHVFSFSLSLSLSGSFFVFF